MPFSVRRWRIAAVVAATTVFALYHLMNSSVYGAGRLPLPPLFSDGMVHWTKLPEHYPVATLIPLPTGQPKPIPKIQTKPPVEDTTAETERLRRLAVVKASFIHSWEGYKSHAWLRDEVVPIAGGYRDTFGGWAATLVDALDTLWIMGLKEDFELAVNAVANIDFTTTEENTINVFETTIRYLGGFLAAYDISGGKYPILLSKAVEVGELLMSVFDTPNRMPISRWDWKAYVAGDMQVASAGMLVSELGSLSLEFTRLSQLTGDDKYFDAIQRVSNAFEASQNGTQLPGMWPVVVNAANLDFAGDNGFTLGGMSDSLYEYLPKQFMMLGGLKDQSRDMYEKFIPVAKKHLFFRPLNPKNLDILISGDLRVNGQKLDLEPRGQHLTCFTGGMVAIGSKIFSRPEELKVAQALTDGCVWAYDSQVTGIAPELFTVVPCQAGDSCEWSDKKWYESVSGLTLNGGEEQILQGLRDRHLEPGFTSIWDRRYILRPEAIESVFIMYRVTGDVEWQNKAWRMFGKIEQACRTFIASSAIDDVTKPKPQQMDSMESFWLAETLKYFYLIFEDFSVVSLDEYVLNTEAHPLKRPGI